MGAILHSLLAEKGYLLCDGAMGTSLFTRGLQTGDAPELWNISFPEKIASVHREFVEAGADILTTNSFGGSAYRLKLHNSEGDVFELNKRAAEIAKGEAMKADRPILIAGSMGPTGEILEPVGTVSIAQAAQAFYEQADALLKGGADFILLETMSSLEEAEAAIKGCQTAGADIVASMTYDTNGRTMMGVLPSDSFQFFAKNTMGANLVGCGLNCGLGPAETLASLLEMHNGMSSPSDIVGDKALAIICQSNCGIPQYKNGEFHYSGTEKLMGDYAKLAYNLGARIIGGCCGSDGKIIKAMKIALDNHMKDIANGLKISTPTLQDITSIIGEIKETSQKIHAHPHPHGASTDEGTSPSRRRKRNK